MNELIETFEIHNRIHLYLLNAIAEDHLEDVAVSKGRTVGEQFAHIHNVRLMWLKAASEGNMPDLEKIEKASIITRAKLENSLIQSGQAIVQLLTQAISTRKIKGFKPHVTAFAGYIISHESHHRGQIILSLKQCGHLPAKNILFGMWEWGSR